jgi:hypothetical protein
MRPCNLHANNHAPMQPTHPQVGVFGKVEEFKRELDKVASLMDTEDENAMQELVQGGWGVDVALISLGAIAALRVHARPRPIAYAPLGASPAAPNTSRPNLNPTPHAPHTHITRDPRPRYPSQPQPGVLRLRLLGHLHDGGL